MGMGFVFEGYGLSEAPTASHCNPLLGENRTGSIGLPLAVAILSEYLARPVPNDIALTGAFHEACIADVAEMYAEASALPGDDPSELNCNWRNWRRPRCL